MVGSKPGPVAVRNDQTWTCGLSLKRLCIVLNRLEAIGFRDVRDGALTPLRLDPASRREDNNTLNMSPRAEPEEEKEPDEPSKTDHSTRDARKFSKGTAMEVAMASALTALDHPERGKRLLDRQGGQQPPEPLRPRIHVRPARQLGRRRPHIPSRLRGEWPDEP